MVRIDGFIEIIYMTAPAFHRGIDKFLATLRDMTGVAIDDNMHAHQWKSPFGVGPHDIFSILPVHGSMAVPAIDTELRPVNIRMAVGTFYSDIGKP